MSSVLLRSGLRHVLQRLRSSGHNTRRVVVVVAGELGVSVIRTLREWGIRLDEALFLGGRPKGPFLQAFGADIFFDDSPHNIDSAREHVAAGHVPHGVANR